jgi:hypothetical protein
MVSSLNYYSFAFNNFVFGGQGSPYQVISVNGLTGLPTLRVQDSDRGYLDGMFSGRDFLSGRTMSISILTMSGNGNTAQANLNLLQAALMPQQTGTSPLQFQLSSAGGLQVINARVRAGLTQVDPEFTFGYIKSQYTFFAPNPAYYDNTVQSASIAPSVIGGRTYNRTYNLTYPAGTLTGSAIINNAGNTTAYPILTLGGPVTNPSVGNLTYGGALNFNYTMGASDVFVVDLYNRTILLNGVPARNLLLGSSTWFNAPPGSSVFYYTGTSFTAGVTSALVQWQNAYL